MEMGELEAAWQGLDDRLAGLERHARREREHRAFDTVRARLRGLTVGQVVQLAVGVGIVLSAGPYWVGHLGDAPHLVVYGIAIHLYGLALLILAVTQLMAVWRVDYRQPVVTVQPRPRSASTRGRPVRCRCSPTWPPASRWRPASAG